MIYDRDEVIFDMDETCEYMYFIIQGVAMIEVEFDEQT